MKYATVTEVRNSPGLRLVLSMGVPGPWGEAAKSLFHVKGIPFVPVGQVVGTDDADLIAWTGVRNAPVAIFNSEKPVDRWIDILMLAERLEPTPRLLPESSEERALVIGITHEICGEWGYGWCRRTMMLGSSPKDSDVGRRLANAYRYTIDAAAEAPRRIIGIQVMLSERLKAQRALGLPYLVGSTLTAADIYWACFSVLLEPQSRDINPLPDHVRTTWSICMPDIDAAKDPILVEHRDFIYKRYLKVPVEF